MDSEHDAVPPGPQDKKHFLDHPEVQEILESIDDLLGESDRGALLLCAEHVNEQLGKLFRKLAPSIFGKKEVDELLSFPGPLSSLSARHNIAALTGLISPELHESIANLRRLRNKAAHATASFRLRDHWSMVSGIFSLGDGVPIGINHLANEIIVRSAIDRLMKVKLDSQDGEHPMFSTPQEALQWMHENSDAIEPLNERGPRLELGIATAIICALIILYRDRGLERRSRTAVTGPGI